MTIGVTFYSKRNCGACDLVRQRLEQFHVKYSEIFDHKHGSPTIVYRGNVLTPPITTSALKTFLTRFKLIGAK